VVTVKRLFARKWSHVCVGGSRHKRSSRRLGTTSLAAASVLANSCKHALSERTTWSSRLHDQAHAAFRSAPAHAPECARLGSCALPAISLQPGWDPDAQLRLARHGRAPGSPAGSRGCWTPPPAWPGRSHWHGSCAVLHGRPPHVPEQTATHSLGLYAALNMCRGALERNACGIAVPAANCCLHDGPHICRCQLQPGRWLSASAQPG